MFAVEILEDTPRPGASTTVLRCREDLDIRTVSDAEYVVRRTVLDGGHALFVDLAGVFVGTKAVGLVVVTAHLCARRGMIFAVVGAPAWMVAVLRRPDVPAVLHHTSVEDALHAVRDDPRGDGIGLGNSLRPT